MPSLGRFASADTIVPNEVDPQAWNRYSYVRNNPLIYNDPSGHCWGLASGMRDWNFLNYGTTCSNMDMAWNIVTHPNATWGERAGAGAYLAAEGGAHVGVAVGGGVVAAKAAAPVVPVVKQAVKTVLIYANMAYQALTTAYPTTTAVVGGLAETAGECALTGGGCTTLDYVVGGATAGAAPRISTPSNSSSGRLQYDANAVGPHTTFRRNGTTGEIDHYATYDWHSNTHPNNPHPFEMTIRVDMVGPSHYNSAINQRIFTPHVHDRGTLGGIRPALPDELTRRIPQ